MFGLEEILLIPLVFGAFSVGAGWGQRARGGVIIGVVMTGLAFKTMMPGLDVRWLRLWPWASLFEIAAIWGVVCWIGFLGGSGGWFGRRARARRGAVPDPESWWLYLPLLMLVAGVAWVARGTLADWFAHGGVTGGVPMAAPPHMIHHLASADAPRRASWGLVLMISPLVGPGILVVAAGLANRNLAFVAMGGLLAALPIGLCLGEFGLRWTPGMLAAMGGLIVVAGVIGWRLGLAGHRMLAPRGRPTGWAWDHSRDGFFIALKRLERTEGRDSSKSV